MSKNDTPEEISDDLQKSINRSKVCFDFYEGSEKVLNSDYLPKWALESAKEHESRIEATEFVNYFGQTVDTISSAAVKIPPNQSGLEKLNLIDVDNNGSSLRQFYKKALSLSVAHGLSFIVGKTTEPLADNDNGSGTARAYLSLYSLKDLAGYQVNDNGALILASFRDSISVADGEYGVKTLHRTIVFKIGGGEIWFDSGDGYIMQDSWENNLGSLPVSILSTGKKIGDMDYIPLFLDVAKLNHTILIKETWIANVLSIVSNPVPILYGKFIEADGEKLGIDVKTAIVFTDKAKNGMEYVEVTGEGVKILQDKVQSGIAEIDKMAFGMLSESNTNTVIDAQRNAEKGGALLSGLALATESAMNTAIKLYAELSDISLSDDAGLTFNTEFIDSLMQEFRLKSISEMRARGDLSVEAMWEANKKAGVLPDDFDSELERARLE